MPFRKYAATSCLSLDTVKDRRPAEQELVVGRGHGGSRDELIDVHFDLSVIGSAETALGYTSMTVLFLMPGAKITPADGRGSRSSSAGAAPDGIGQGRHWQGLVNPCGLHAT